MRIYGLDFTSAPRRGKPITCAAGTLENGLLRIEALVAFESFETFENFLASPEPWVAGIDFPFGQPAALRRDLGWPDAWEDYVRLVGAMSITEFERVLGEYRAARPEGEKHHLRETDRRAGSRSPMMLYGVPVARMFFRGAPRLERAGVDVVPCRRRSSERVVVEAYPALLARRYIGRRSYKSDTRRGHTTEREAARRELLRALQGEALARDYGLGLAVPTGLIEEFATDGSADRLDAMLCAVQAAWSWSRRGSDFGMPPEVDPHEGWIADPALEDRQAEAKVH